LESFRVMSMPSQKEVDMARSSKPTLGLVGLGDMGGNMAARFLAAGHTVYGEERSRDQAQALIDAGLCWGETVREVTERAEIVFTSLPDAAL
jgi:3-hydroxyisobutyrate dehydrogenase-like beta-hydroxyacid dehydrogenase